MSSKNLTILGVAVLSRHPYVVWLERYTLAVTIPNETIVRLAAAIGIGMLIGAERERRKGTGRGRGAAGVRTFTLAALAGALTNFLNSEALLVVIAAGAIAFSALAYHRSSKEDPGLTSEFALVVAVLLGAMAMQAPLPAAGLGVVTTVLLASRGALHRAFRNLLSEQEAHDALVFLATALVVLPLAPNKEMGPFGAFNPRRISELVVLVMGISSVSHIALRAAGARLGLALAGFLGGFVSASATIGSMGGRAKQDAAMRNPAVSGAVLATVATVIQMFAVLALSNLETCRAVVVPLLFAGIAAVGYSVVFIVRSSKSSASPEPNLGRVFDVRLAVVFAITISAALFLCGLLDRFYGDRGLLLGAALSGFADTHATAISIASLVTAGKIKADAAVIPILVGFTTNTATKAIVAISLGGRQFALRILPGLLLVVTAAFFGLLIAK